MTHAVPYQHDQTSPAAVLFVATLSSFLTPFMGSAINIALPSMSREFHLTAVTMSWIALAYLLAAAVCLVPFGKLADIVGRKKIFAYGIGLFSLSSLLSAVAPSALFLIGARVLQGVGSAMIFGTGIAVLTSVFPAGRRGQVLGINAAAVYLGLSLGPFLGGFLTHQFGWRSVFWVTVPAGIAVLALVVTKIRAEWKGAAGDDFDIAGSLVYAFSLVSLMYGFSLLPALSGFLLAGFGSAGMVGFILIETAVRYPVFNVSLLLENRLFAFSSLAAFINYSATFAVSFLLSLYLQNIKGLDSQVAGTVLVFQPVVMVLLSPVAGWASDRIEPRLVSSAGMSLTVVGLILFSLVKESSSAGYLVAVLILFGAGLALFSSPNTNAVMSAVDRHYYGVASATLGTMRLTGQMFSMGIATLVFSLTTGQVKVTPEYYNLLLPGIRLVFIIFACLGLIGVAASLARGRAHS